MLELVAVLAVAGVFAAVVVPGASKARSAVSAAEAARRLALVLRAAQAQAQSSASPVRVEVGEAGEYRVRQASGSTHSGSLGARISTNYPGGVLEFSARGWAGLPGAASPRAGRFDVVGTSHTVIVQLSGCIRCA